MHLSARQLSVAVQCCDAGQLKARDSQGWGFVLEMGVGRWGYSLGRGTPQSEKYGSNIITLTLGRRQRSLRPFIPLVLVDNPLRLNLMPYSRSSFRVCFSPRKSGVRNSPRRRCSTAPACSVQYLHSMASRSSTGSCTLDSQATILHIVFNTFTCHSSHNPPHKP